MGTPYVFQHLSNTIELGYFLNGKRKLKSIK